MHSDASAAAGGKLHCHAPRAVVVMVLESLGAQSVLHIEAIRNDVNATQGTIQDDLRGRRGGALVHSADEDVVSVPGEHREDV